MGIVAKDLIIRGDNDRKYTRWTVVFADDAGWTELEAKIAAITDYQYVSTTEDYLTDMATVLPDLLDDFFGIPFFSTYAHPLVTGLRSKSKNLSVLWPRAHVFGSTFPAIYDPWTEPYTETEEYATIGDFIMNFRGSSAGDNTGTGVWNISYSSTNTPPIPTNNPFYYNGSDFSYQAESNNTCRNRYLLMHCDDITDPVHTVSIYPASGLPDYPIRIINVGAPYSSDRKMGLTAQNLGNNIGNGCRLLTRAIAGMSDDDIEDFTPGKTEDPYSVDGYSEQQGGQGTASWEGDLIGIPALPSLSAVDTGFISLYNPTAAQVQALASYMWSQNFDLSIFKNVVANPIDCILGLAIFPIDPQNGTAKTIKVGNIPTDVSMPPVTSQWQEKDCGTLDVQEYWGSYLDYSPYTKISLYLPYIGIVPLDVDDVMNGPIRVVYHIDMLSGACVAYVLCHGTQLYTYNGQCSCNVPITSNDFTNTVNGILGIAGNIGSLVAAGGKTGGTISAVAGIASNVVNAFKPNVQKSGALSGTGGLMGVQVPYLIMQRPKQSLARTHASTKGYPSNISVVLGSISGYAEIEAIDLEGVPCTQAEAEEIETLLKAGVFL